MIHLSTDARLNIILPNTNKALAEAIKSATPEQLSTLKEGKDIKSLITSVFQDKITASKSDQVLLDILKNGAAFKHMGNFAEELRSLVSESKALPGLNLKSEGLEHFLKNFASLSGETLKSRLSDSGVFMESKIASAIQTLPSLKEALVKLQTLLSQSALPEAKALANSVASVVNRPVFQEAQPDPSSVRNLADALKKITDTLGVLTAKSDPLYSKETAGLADTLTRLASAETSPQEIKSALSQLYGTLLSSTSKDSVALLDTLEGLLKIVSAPMHESDSSSGLKELVQQLRTAINNADPLLSEETSKVMAQLGALADPEALQIDTLLQKSLGDDLKSQLLKLSEELQNTAQPKAAELLEHVDKLLSIIDYHQLVSYLNTSNSIYFPFTWDRLEEGSMAFKKGKEKKFYCEINLRLKEYGELNLMMALYDENRLDIQAHTEKSELKEQLMQNMPQLRTLLIEAGLVPQTIRVFEMRERATRESESYTAERSGPDLGFEVKV